MKTFRTAGVLALALVAGSTVVGLEVHVHPEGDDSAPGTRDRPLATLKAACEKVRGRPDATGIVLHEGTYSGEALLRPEHEAADLARLSVRPAAGARVVIDGGQAVSEAEPVASAPGVYRILANTTGMWEQDIRTRYVQVADARTVRSVGGTFACDGDDLIFHTPDDGPLTDHDIEYARDGVGIRVRRANVVIEGLRFRNFHHGTWASGLIIEAPNVVVRDCEVTNARAGFFVGAKDTADVRIENCQARDVGCGLYTMAQDMTTENCRFFKQRDAFEVPTYWQDDTGIQYYDPADGGTIRGNLVVGFAQGIYCKCRGVFTVEHNTVIGSTSGLYRSNWNAGNRFTRNIVVDVQRPFHNPRFFRGGCVADHNLLWQPRQLSLFHESIDWAARVGNTHNAIADPRFASPHTGDYRLRPDSPAIALALAKNGGRPLGALEAVSPDAPDQDPPVVSLALERPAVRAGSAGRLFFENDPWNGGQRSLVRMLHRATDGADFVSRDNTVQLSIDARDTAGRPADLQVRVDEQPWGEVQPFRPRLGVTLADNPGMHVLAVRVSDDAGNQSEQAQVSVLVTRDAPQVSGAPTVHANEHGVVVSFRTDRPAFAHVEFGPDPSYGKTGSQPPYVQRRWDAMDGGDWVSQWDLVRTVHHVPLLAPVVDPGLTYHYRIVVGDAVGNRATGPDQTFTVTGPARTLHVEPGGLDADDRHGPAEPLGSIQFAVDRALPGDTVLVGPGVYVEPVYISHGGLPGAPIRLEGAAPGEVVLDGVRRHDSLLRLEGAGHVHLRNLEVRWFTGHGRGIYVADSPHVRLESSKVWNTVWGTHWGEGYGVFVHRSPGFVAEGNLLLRQEIGVVLLQSPRSRIVGNTAVQNLYGAVNYYYSAADSQLFDNSFTFNGNDQFMIEAFDRSELESFQSDYNNFATELRPSEDNPPEKVIKAPHPVLRSGSKAIMYYDGQRFHTMEAWRQFSGKDQHSIFADPLYVDPVNYDFRLQGESPNIGAGREAGVIGAFGTQ